MSEIYSDVEEEESVHDEGDEYGEEFEEDLDDENENAFSPLDDVIEDEAFSPIEIPKTKSVVSSNNGYDEEYEDESDDYEDDYSNDENESSELNKSSVLVAGETQEVASPINNHKPTPQVIKEEYVKSDIVNKSEIIKEHDHVNIDIKETEKDSTSTKKDESIDTHKPKSILKKKPSSGTKVVRDDQKNLSSGIERGSKEHILKNAVDVSLDILNGVSVQGKENQPNKPERVGSRGPPVGSSLRRKMSFKGETPVTSTRSARSGTKMKSSISGGDAPLSNYQTLLSEISTRKQRSRSKDVLHSPSGFDLRGLEEFKVEGRVADAWGPSQEWAAQTMKNVKSSPTKTLHKKGGEGGDEEGEEEAKRRKKKTKKKKRRPKKESMAAREAASRAALMEEYLKSTKNEATQEHVPVGVPGVRDIKKIAFVYDINGRKMTQEELDAVKTRTEEQKKRSEEQEKKQEQMTKEAQKLLPSKSPLRKFTNLTGNIKQAYDQYVKQRQEQVAQMNDIVSQFRSARLHWLDMRVEDIFPSPGDSQAQKDALLATTTTTYEQPIKWGLYEALGEGDVIITIETKTSWRPGSSPYSRHNPSTYKDAVNNLTRKLLDRCQGRAQLRMAIELCGGFAESAPKRIKHVEGRPEARLGSFEVQVGFLKNDRLVVETLFSKLQSHHWPNTDRLVDKIVHKLSTCGFNIVDTSVDVLQGEPVQVAWKGTVRAGSNPKAVNWLFDGRQGIDRTPMGEKQDNSEVQDTATPLPEQDHLGNTALNTTAPLDSPVTTFAMTQSQSNTLEQPGQPLVTFELPQELTDWLTSLGPTMVQYAPLLNGQGFDTLVSIATLSDTDRQYFTDIKPGHWRLLLEAVKQLQEKNAAVDEELVRRKREEEEKEEMVKRQIEETRKKEEEEALALVRKKKEEEETLQF